MRGFVFLFAILLWVALPPTAQSNGNTGALSSDEEKSLTTENLPKLTEPWQYTADISAGLPREPATPIEQVTEPPNSAIIGPQNKPSTTEHQTSTTHATQSKHHKTTTLAPTSTESQTTPTDASQTTPQTQPNTTPTEPQTTPTDASQTTPQTQPNTTPTEPQTTPTDASQTTPQTQPNTSPTEPQSTLTDASQTTPQTQPNTSPTEPQTTPTDATTIPTSPSTPSSCGFVPDCPATGIQLIANPCPQSCQKYFYCQDGSWSAKVCLPWENFHPERLSCEWWWNVDCSWLQPTTPSSDLTTLPEWTTPSPITPRTPCVFTPKCPPTGTIKIANPCNCQKFFNCVDGKHEEMSCLPWDNFDPQKLECVFSLDVNCGWSNTLPTTASSTTSTEPPTTAATTIPTTQPTTTPTTQTEAPATSQPTVNPNECNFKPSCPQVGSELIPIPCEGYCSRYYECTGGKAQLKTCPKRWYVVQQNFHPVQKECQLPIKVNCDWYKQ